VTAQPEGVGARVKALRIQRCPQESGRKFAERAGVNYAHLNKIEKGRVRPQLDTLGRIAQALSVELNELLSGVNTPPAA